MIRFLIMHQTVAKHDAIGNDIEKMFEILNMKYECKVYAENQFNDKVVYLNQDEINRWLTDTEVVVIYHHSVYWQHGEELLEQCIGKIIFRYHNITPPEFFEPYNEHHYHQCLYGREQTIRLAKKYNTAYWLSASKYNALDIDRIVPEKRIAICAPFHKIEEWAQKTPDEEILKTLLFSQTVNLLFVGRIAPNKGHLMLIELLQHYCVNFDTKIKLRVIGKFDEGLSGYNEKLLQLVESYGLENHVEFIGEINDATLMSYYLGSDIFLCASEHEGFCVPIIEAQFFQLPIIALSSTAIPETIGDNQIILLDNAQNFAAAIKVIMDKQQYRAYLREQGVNNFNARFAFEKIEKNFKSIIESWCGVSL